MAFTINKNLFFIDGMQFINFSLDALVKDMSNNDLKRLLQEFRGKFLKLVKQKGVYPYEYMDSFEKFFDDKVPDRCTYFSSLKENVLVKKIICMLLMFGLCLT